MLSAGSQGVQNQPVQPTFATVVPALIGPGPSAIGNQSAPAVSLASGLPPGTPPSATPAQLEQIFFTASVLVSGVQLPISPYEKIVTPAPIPNIPQQFSTPSIVPEILGLTIPAAGARPVRLGGSGGDSLSSGNTTDSLYANNVQDEIWPTFGNREDEGPTSEVATEELLNELMGLGQMDDLMRGDVVPPGGNTVPGGIPGSSDPKGESDLLEDHVDPGKGARGDSAQSDLIERDEVAPRIELETTSASQAQRITAPMPTTEIYAAHDRALIEREGSDWPAKSRVLIGAALALLMASKDYLSGEEDWPTRFELRSRN
jgi:hypothetical protein